MARVFKLKGVLFAAALAGLGTLGSTAVHAAEIESWENPASAMDGWISPQGWIGSADHTTGVTHLVTSLNMVSPHNTTTGDSPTYGQMLQSPFSLPLTAELATASTISFDVTTTSGATGFFQQWDCDIVNNDPTFGTASGQGSFVSLDGFSYQAVTIGSTTTLTVSISKAVKTALNDALLDGSPTQLIFQVGGGNTVGNDQFWIDNVRDNTTNADLGNFSVPEPGSLSLIGLAGLSLLGRRRK
jgi:hypothetical protein